MRTLEEIQKQYDKFVCAAISAEYNRGLGGTT